MEFKSLITYFAKTDFYDRFSHEFDILKNVGTKFRNKVFHEINDRFKILSGFKLSSHDIEKAKINEKEEIPEEIHNFGDYRGDIFTLYLEGDKIISETGIYGNLPQDSFDICNIKLKHFERMVYDSKTGLLEKRIVDNKYGLREINY